MYVLGLVDTKIITSINKDITRLKERNNRYNMIELS